MILGVGCDIVKIERIEKQISEFSDKFLNRIYTQNEVDNAPKNQVQRIAYFAKRFAAKEAISKALGTGIGKTVAFTDIEITNKSNKAPMAAILSKPEVIIHISLSDEAEYAMAYCVLIKNDAK